MNRIRNKEYEIRPADPNQDLDWAYAIFKQAIRPFIEKMIGNWPEEVEHTFFSSGLHSMPMKVVMHKGNRIGCFAIIEEEQRVTVQRMYMDPLWQGTGIGSWVIDEALKIAHTARKPLITEVLANNEPAIEFYLRKGFKKIREQPDDPIIQLVIMHGDTEPYCSPEIEH